ncbi:S8 family serine peptidase [Gemmatimonadota bacterium]
MCRYTKYISFAFLFILYTNAAAQKITPELEEILLPAPADSVITVLVRPALAVETHGLQNELLRTRATRAERHRRMIGELKHKSRAAQQSIRQNLESGRLAGRVRSYRQFWITNLVAVTATAAEIRLLAARSDVAEVLENRTVKLQATKKKKSRPGFTAPDATLAAVPRLPADTPFVFNWGLRRINAHKAWERGITGRGIIVATIDSGVDGDHPALKDKWRGANGATAAESWYDPHNGGSFPIDDITTGSNATHGTHVMGCIVGQDGPDTTGVAPDAQWIAAKGFSFDGYTSSDILIDCMEWMADPDGDAATMDDVPDILNLSWADDYTNGCFNTYDEPIFNLMDLGVTVIMAIGNNSIKIGMPASKPEFFAVGATDQNDAMALFSIRGPSICDNTTIKPDVVAPGDDILSPRGSLAGGGYSTIDGTSFATPMVVGIAALLKQYNPELSPFEITEAIRNSVEDLGDTGPDNEFGYGLVNAEAALNSLAPASSPGFSITGIEVTAGSDGLISPGEQAQVVLSLTSLGTDASAVSATVSSVSTDVTVSLGTASFGDIPFGGEASNSQAPFVFIFSSQVPDNASRIFYLEITSGSVSRTVSFVLNVGGEPEPPKKSMATHNVGKARLSLTNYGIIGTDAYPDGGGFQYPYSGLSTPDHLFQGSLLIATGPMTVSDATYNDDTVGFELFFDQDFHPVSGGNIQVLTPGIYADQEITGAFDDSKAENPLEVRVYQTSYAWSTEADDDYVIVEYKLVGPENKELPSVYLAQHMDWDVGLLADENMVGYDSGLNLAYMYDDLTDIYYVGHALLTQQISGFRAVNYQQDVSDGLTEAEKFTYMTSGVADTVGFETDDWSELLSTGPVRLKPGREVVVAFAMAGGSSLAELRANVAAAQARYAVLAGLKSVDLEAPSITSEQHPDADHSLDSYSIRAVVTDENEIDKVLLYWRLRSVGVFYGIEQMSRTDSLGSEFEGDIPAQALGEIVDYYILAADAQGNLRYLPQGAPREYFSFSILDIAGPEISNSTVLWDSTTGDNYLLQAEVTDKWLARVYAVLGFEEQEFRDTLEMLSMPGTPGVFTGTVGEYSLGTTVDYYIVAEDSAGNISTDPAGAPDSMYSFEYTPHLSGDVDLSGAVNIFDLLKLLRILSGDEPLEPELIWVADIDNSGSVNIFDLIALLQLLSTQPGPASGS